MRLGTFINQLQRIDPEKTIRFQCPYCTRKVPEYSPRYINSIGVGDFYSYRGYYDNLSITPSMETTYVRDVLTEAEDAVDAYFTGYKGGLYKMTDDTLLWCSDYGTASNLFLTEIFVNDSEVIIDTKEQLNDYDNGDTPIETVLERIGFCSSHIQYSLDGGASWHQKVVESIYDILDEYKDRAYFSKEAVHIKNWSAWTFCAYVLNIENHDYIIIKPVDEIPNEN